MIKLYSKPNCMPCMATKMYLNQNKIPFEEVVAESDEEVLNYIRELGYSQLPVVVTPTQSWSGFQPDLLEQLI